MSEPRPPRRIVNHPGEPTRSQLQEILARYLAEDADLAAFVQKLRKTDEPEPKQED